MSPTGGANFGPAPGFRRRGRRAFRRDSAASHAGVTSADS